MFNLECPNCDGKGYFSTFSKPCTESDMHKKSACRLCRGKCVIHTQATKCTKCEGFGGFNKWDRPTRETDMHYERDCPVCGGVGWTFQPSYPQQPGMMQPGLYLAQSGVAPGAGYQPVQTTGARKECPNCDAKGYFSTFSKPCTESDMHKKSACRLCKGKCIIFGDATKCTKCDGLGGFNRWDKPVRETDMHYERDCPVCEGVGWILQQPFYSGTIQPTGYPPASNTGYPPNNGYPPSEYPPNNGCPPAASNGHSPNNGYPTANNGYPPNSGYPPTANNEYPPNNGYPPAANTGYPPAANNGYPPAANTGYPPQHGQPTHPATDGSHGMNIPGRFGMAADV